MWRGIRSFCYDVFTDTLTACWQLHWHLCLCVGWNVGAALALCGDTTTHHGRPVSQKSDQNKVLITFHFLFRGSYYYSVTDISYWDIPLKLKKCMCVHNVPAGNCGQSHTGNGETTVRTYWENDNSLILQHNKLHDSDSFLQTSIYSADMTAVDWHVAAAWTPGGEEPSGVMTGQWVRGMLIGMPWAAARGATTRQQDNNMD